MDKISPEFAAALVKATSQIEGVVKDSDNPYFKSRYADLATVIAAVKKPLADNGIAFFQRLIPSDRIQVETIAIYKSGEILSLGTISLPVEKNTAQAVGSAVSYARRYGLACAFSVPQLDDDGHAASEPVAKPPMAKSPKVEALKPAAIVSPYTVPEPAQIYIYKIPDPTKKQLEFFANLGIRPEGDFYKVNIDLGPKAADYLVSWDEYQEYLRVTK